MMCNIYNSKITFSSSLPLKKKKHHRNRNNIISNELYTMLLGTGKSDRYDKIRPIPQYSPHRIYKYSTIYCIV